LAVSGHGYYDGGVRLWDLTTGLLVGVFDGHRFTENTNQITIVGSTFLPDGKAVASTSSHGITFIWRVSDFNILSHPIRCGPLNASISGNRGIFGVKVWRLPEFTSASDVPVVPCSLPKSNAEGLTLATPAFHVKNTGYDGFGFSPDGALFGVRKNYDTPAFFELSRRKQVVPVINGGDMTAFSQVRPIKQRNKDVDISASIRFRAFALRNSNAARNLRTTFYPPNSTRSHLFFNGKWVVKREYGQPLAVYDVSKNVELVRLRAMPEHDGFQQLTQIAISIDERWMALSDDKKGGVWETGSWERVLSITGSKHNHVIGFCSNGAVFASIVDRNLTFWSTDNWKQISKFTSDDVSREFGGLSPSGDSFVSIESGSNGKQVVIRNIATKAESKRIGTGDTVSVQFVGADYILCRERNPDSAVLWRIQDGSRTVQVDFNRIGSEVRQMRVGPNGRFLASYHVNGNVYVWDVCDAK
jgi:WD40 repeat protein